MTSDLITRLITLRPFPDEVFACVQLRSDPLFVYKKIRPEKEAELIQMAFACGRGQAVCLRDRCGSTAPSVLAADLGITISPRDLQPECARVLLAVYRAHPPVIQLCRPMLRHVERMLETHCLRDFLGDFSLQEMVVAHEIFHHLEGSHSELATNRCRVRIWRGARFTGIRR